MSEAYAIRRVDEAVEGENVEKSGELWLASRR